MVVRTCACKGNDKVPMQDSKGTITCNTCGYFIEKGLSQIIKDEQLKPCGCHIKTYSDDRVEMTACEIHAPLQQMGIQLHQMGLALRQAQGILKVYAHIIVGYKIIAEGCKRHPSYRPLSKPPTGPHSKCTCKQVWNAKMFLDTQRKQFASVVEAGQQYHPVYPVPDTMEEDSAKGSQEIDVAISQGDAVPFVMPA